MDVNEIVENINSDSSFTYESPDGSLSISSFSVDGAVSEYEIIIRLTKRCNYRCLYCGVAFEEPVPKKSLKDLYAILDDADLSKSNIVLSGGEPTISPFFFSLLRKVQKSRCRKICIQTNASLFSLESFFDRFPKDYCISFFASLPSVVETNHKHITCSTLLDNAFHGLLNIVKRNYYTEICIVVNRHNYKSITKTIRTFLAALPFHPFFPFQVYRRFSYLRDSVLLNECIQLQVIGLVHQGFIITFWQGFPPWNPLDVDQVSLGHLTISTCRSKLNFRISNVFLNTTTDIDSYIVSYSEAFPYISKALCISNVGLMDTGDCSFPVCVRSTFPDLKKMHTIFFDDSICGIDDLSKPYFKLSSCSECIYNDYCQGFQTEYVKRFGTSEIKPIREATSKTI